MAEFVDGTVLKYVAVFTLPNASTAMNVYYAGLFSGGPVNVGTVSGHLRDHVEDMMGEIELYIKSTVALSTVEVYARDQGEWVPAGAAAGSWTGWHTGEMLPHGVAAIVEAKSDVASVSARKYIAGYTEPAQGGGAWNSSVLAHLGNYFVEWIQPWSVGGIQYASGVWSDKEQQFIQFSGEGVLTTWCAYQRRRKPGVGI